MLGRILIDPVISSPNAQHMATLVYAPRKDPKRSGKSREAHDNANGVQLDGRCEQNFVLNTCLPAVDQAVR